MQPSPESLRSFTDQNGVSLLDLSRQRPALVVFLRHAGCTFCRQALADLAEARHTIEAAGTGIALVHMGTEEEGQALTARFGLADLPRISDPDRRLYQEFELSRGSVSQVAGPRVWLRGLKAILTGNLVGTPKGDVLQLPGAFLLSDGKIVKAFRHATSADRPDYCQLAAWRESPGTGH